MIYNKVGKDNKLVLIYDTPQHDSWRTNGRCGTHGLNRLFQGLTSMGVDPEDVSIVCLTDDPEGKAAGYKMKAPYIKEFLDTLAPNLILLPTAKSFEKVLGLKGVSKYYGQVVPCSEYNSKALVMPPYAILKHQPQMQAVIDQCLASCVSEMEYPEIREAEKAKKHFTLVDTIEKWRSFYKFYKENVFSFAFDIETNSLQFNKGKIITLQFSHRKNYGYCIPTPEYHWNWSEAEWTEIIAGVSDLIADNKREKIGANIYFDLKFVHYQYGVPLPKENVYDVLIASFLHNENRDSHSLKYCAATLLEGFRDYDAPLEVYKDTYCKEHKIKKMDFTYDLIPLDILFEYSCLDVDASIQLAEFFKVALLEEEQEEVMQDVRSYAWALARIELTGWQVDLEEAAKYEQDLTERVATLASEIKDRPEIKVAVKGLSQIQLEKENAKRKTPLTELKTPLEFLITSTAHKRYLCKDILKLPEIKKTKSGQYSTDKESLNAWKEQRPTLEVLSLMQEHDALKKMRSTYVLAILNRSVDSRIHCSFRVTGAATGRISCTQPNMQNIAMHSAEAQKLKNCFVSKPGHSLVVADLSNAELRITAAISQDPVMCNSFRQGLDPHSATAKSVFDIPIPVEEIKESPEYKHYRQIAKTLGFAALYGAAPSLIAKTAGISEAAAEKNLSDYFNKHVGVRNMLNENIKFAKANGYSLAVSGRKRRVPHIKSTDKGEIARAERQANNFIVQSVASDGMLQSLVNMWTEIDKLNLPYKIINVIHDSCEMEVPDECVKDATEFIIRHLSRWPKGLDADFPMKADCEVGKTWADLQHYKEEAIEFETPDEEDEEEVC